MKKIIALALAAWVAGPALAQPSVGVSIGINRPGVYGRINIGELPRPALLLPEPVIIEAPRYGAGRRPIYLYVPLVQQQNWRRYCGRYNACGQPVYFVRDEWVRDRYQSEHPGWDRGHPHHEAERGGHDHADRDHGDGREHEHDRRD